MLKKSLYFFLSLLFFQSVSHANRDALKTVNQQYMQLMFGHDGILAQKATLEQINQMIDGCITAGIIDRLYGLDNQSAAFRAQISKFEGFRKLDVQLAYGFYKLGYGNYSTAEALKHDLASESQLESNFDHEFDTLCTQVYPRNIIEYKQSLENVIKRASKPLRFDDFIAIEIDNRAPSGTVTPVTTRSMRSVGSSLTLKQNVRDSEAYKTYISLGVSHEKAMQLLSQVVNEYTEEDTSAIPPADLSSLAFSPVERYYTDAEISTLENTNAMAANFYKTKKAEKMSAEVIRAKLKSIMQINIGPKYEGK